MNSANLVSLPDELLLLVVGNVGRRDRQRALYNLSLVNRRLANFMHDELYFSPSVSPTTAYRLLTCLLKAPDMAAKITELTVQHIQVERYRLRHWIFDGAYLKSTGTFTQAGVTQKLTVPCRRALQIYGVWNEHLWWAPRLRQNDTFAYIGVSLLLIPGLKRLNLSLQFATALFNQRESGTSLSLQNWPYMVGLLRCGLKSLEEIRIDSSQRSPRTKFVFERDVYSLWPLGTTGLNNVKHVELALPDFAKAPPMYRVGKLPQNVQSLHLTFHNSKAIEELDVHRSILHEEFPNLKVTMGLREDEAQDEASNLVCE